MGSCPYKTQPALATQRWDFALLANATGSNNTAIGRGANITPATIRDRLPHSLPMGKYWQHSQWCSNALSQWSRTKPATGFQALFSNGPRMGIPPRARKLSIATEPVTTIQPTLAPAFNNTGNWNTASGSQALYSNSGGFSIRPGVWALYSNTVGFNNTATGVQALHSNTSGRENTAIAPLLSTMRTPPETQPPALCLSPTQPEANTALGFGAGEM
jgi:hypothetical protein